MNKTYESTVSTQETTGSAGPWYLKGEINEGSPLIVPPSYLEAIPDNTEREGIQGKPKSLRVEKTEIKVLEVLEFSKQCPGEEEAIHKKKSKQTNKQKSSQRRLWIFGWIQICSGTGRNSAQAVQGATVRAKTLRRKCKLNTFQSSYKAANWSDFPPARMERSHWTWGVI